MRFQIITAFILFTKIVFSQAIGQIAWETFLGSVDTEVSPGFIHPDGNGNFILLGGKKSEGQLGSRNISFCWLDSLGQELKFTTLDLGGDESAMKLFDTKDGNYILLANSECWGGDGRGNHTNEKFASDMAICKITRDAQLIWKLCIGSYGNEDTGNLFQLEDGFILVFQFDDYEIGGDIDTSLGKEDIMVMRLSEDGEILWKKVFGGSDTDYLWSVLMDKNDDLIFSSYTYSKDGNLSGREDYQHTWICKMDLNGNIKKDIFLGFPDCTTSSGIGLTSSDSLIWYGQYGNRTHDRGNIDTLYGDAFYVFVDTSGSLGDFHFFGGSGQDMFFTMNNINSDFLFNGKVYSNDRDLSARPNSFPAPWLVKINGSGEIIGQYLYEKQDENFTDVYILNEEELLLVGSKDENTRIIKLSSKIDRINEMQGVGEFIIYPNPASTELFIEHKDSREFSIEIFNSIGQQIEIYSTQLNGAKTLVDLTNVPSGIYVLSILVDGNKTVAKFSIR